MIRFGAVNSNIQWLHSMCRGNEFTSNRTKTTNWKIIQFRFNLKMQLWKTLPLNEEMLKRIYSETIFFSNFFIECKWGFQYVGDCLMFKFIIFLPFFCSKMESNWICFECFLNIADMDDIRGTGRSMMFCFPKQKNG